MRNLDSANLIMLRATVCAKVNRTIREQQTPSFVEGTEVTIIGYHRNRQFYVVAQDQGIHAKERFDFEPDQEKLLHAQMGDSAIPHVRPIKRHGRAARMTT